MNAKRIFIAAVVGVLWTAVNAYSQVDETSLLAWYDFDDNTDATGRINLTEVNVPQYTDGYGSANTITPDRWNVDISSNGWKLSKDKSFVVRFRPTESNGFGTVFKQYHRDYVGVSDGEGIGGRLKVYGALASSGVPTFIYPAQGEWVHVVVTRDVATGFTEVWVDGVLSGSGTPTGSLSTGTAIIGDSNVDIAELSFWNRKLTPAEITALYNGGAEVTYAALSTLSSDQPPSVSDFEIHVGEDDLSSQSGDALQLGAANDPEGAPLSISAVSGSGTNLGQPVAGAHGTFVLNSSGAFTYQLAQSLDELAEGELDTTEQFTVTLSDGSKNVDFTITVRVVGSNDAPTVVDNTPITLAASEGAVFSHQFAASAFGDPDGPSLTLSIDGELPDGFVYDPATRTLGSSGQPVTAAAAIESPYSLSLSASDGSFPTAESISVALEVAPDNKPPVANGPVAAPAATAGKLYEFAIPISTFSDPEGDAMIWTITATPAWLSVAGNGMTTPPTLSGTPGDADVGVTQTVTVSVTDEANPGEPATSSFTIEVAPSIIGADSPTILSSSQAPSGARIDLANDDLLISNLETAQIRLSTNGTERLSVGALGGVVIETTDDASRALSVKGEIRAAKVVVDADWWADFVFAEDYVLPSIEEVAVFIKENGRLPGVPSEQEVKVQGLSVAESQAMLLQKVEELTLYIIELKRENQDLRRMMEAVDERY